MKYIHAMRANKKIFFSFTIYIGICIAATWGIMPLWIQIPFLLYAVFIFFIIWEPLQHSPHEEIENKKTKKFFFALGIFAFLFLLTTRLFPFIRYGEAPLGYDTGFYWQYFHLIIPAGKIGNAVISNHLAYIPWFPLSSLGLSALSTIHLLHITHQILTIGAFYFLLRSIPLPKKYVTTVSIIGCFLFAVSLNQFMAYWWMFYKQSMALPFLLFGLALFMRRSWLALPFFAFGVMIHAYPAIPFTIALTLFIVFRIITNIVKKEKIDRDVWCLIIGGILTTIILLILKGSDDIQSHISYLLHFKGLATGGKSWEIAQAKGLFLPFFTFRMNTIFYLPFAVMGVLEIRHWLFASFNNRTITIPLIFAIALILGIFPFLYQNRSLILLDLFLIILATYPLALFIDRFLSYRIGQYIVALLLIGNILFISGLVWSIEPQLYSDEAQELAQLRPDIPNPIRKGEDYVMATSSLYTPWIYAYTGFEATIVPGWLTWDRWNLNMWQEFWSGNNDARRLELLRVYGNRRIYIFVGKHQILDSHLKNFLENNEHIQRISPHVWLYSPIVADNEVFQPP